MKNLTDKDLESFSNQWESSWSAKKELECEKNQGSESKQKEIEQHSQIKGQEQKDKQQ